MRSIAEWPCGSEADEVIVLLCHIYDFSPRLPDPIDRVHLNQRMLDIVLHTSRQGGI